MPLAALIAAVAWLLVIAIVVVLCVAAKRGDSPLRDSRDTPGEVVPLIRANHMAEEQHVFRDAR